MDILTELKQLILNADNYVVELQKVETDPQDISGYKLGFVEGGVRRIIKEAEEENGNRIYNKRC